MPRSQRHLEEFYGGGSDGTAGLGVSVTIDAPTAGAQSNPVVFQATATNAEGGDARSFVNWSSNVDGKLGTGFGFDATLTAGAHTVTAECGGVTDTVAITVS